MSELTQVKTINGEYSGFADSELRAVSADFMQTTAMTAYQPVGEYLSANALDNLSGTWETVTAKANADDLTAYQTIADMTAYQPSGDYQPAGEYLSANALDNVSGTWNDVTAKVDTTAMTAYQPAGDYLSATESANYYPMTGNPSGFISEVPDTYLQNTDLTISDGKITEISGVPLSAGDELPEAVSAATDYVTATSGDINSTIDNVSANSGTWGGSALPISAGPGIKVELVDNTLVFSTDETVLWTGTCTSGQSATLNENIGNFAQINVYAYSHNGSPYRGIIQFATDGNNQIYGACNATWQNNEEYSILMATCSGNTVKAMGSVIIYNGSNLGRDETIYKVVGINRISGGE